MSAVPLRNNKAAASAVRTVTVLGATGSIGDSTMDLLRGSRDRYQVEALTANTNVEGLAKLAREFGARFAAVADPGAPRRIEGRAGRHRHRMRRRRERRHRGRRASGRLGDGGGQRRGRTEARAGGGRSRRHAWRSPTRNAWSAPAISSCSARRRPGPASCRRIPNTTRCFRRWAPATARNWFASSSPPRAGRSAPGPPPTSSRRRWRRR